jgi:hypothetical protein
MNDNLEIDEGYAERAARPERMWGLVWFLVLAVVGVTGGWLLYHLLMILLEGNRR